MPLACSGLELVLDLLCVCQCVVQKMVVVVLASVQRVVIGRYTNRHGTIDVGCLQVGMPLFKELLAPEASVVTINKCGDLRDSR